MKINEIGSEFGVGKTTLVQGTRCFNPGDFGFLGDIMYVLAGRTAIDVICQDIQVTRHVSNVYMPAYCCDSMIYPFVQRGIHVDFYDVIPDEEKGIICQVDSVEHADILYINNYFGFETSVDINVIIEYKKRGTIILYDRTHSLFSGKDDLIGFADYTFASLRKWLELPTGAIVNKCQGKFSLIALKDCDYAIDKLIGMQMKFRYLQGDHSVAKSLFFEYFDRFNKQLSKDFSNYRMDKISFSLLQNKDYKCVQRKRQKNASYLYERLGTMKEIKFIFDISGDVVPLFVPVLLPSPGQRSILRNALKNRDIYIPVHWSKHEWLVPEMRANEIFDRELSLVCDQRYSLDDMKRIVDTIQEYNN